MYFQANTVMASGSDFSVQVRVNTCSALAFTNAVEADFTYPINTLTYVATYTAKSDFDINASTNGGSGSVNIGRGTSSRRTGDLLVATITFDVIGSGSPIHAIQNTSALADATTSMDILGQKINGTFTSIVGPLVPVYRMSNSITHERLFTTSLNERDNALSHYPG